MFNLSIFDIIIIILIIKSKFIIKQIANCLSYMKFSKKDYDINDNENDNSNDNDTNNSKTPFILGICGATCSGKSTVCREIIKKINSTLENNTPNNKSNNKLNNFVVILSQDRYYKGGSAETNYDVPDAIDFDLLEKDIISLKNGKSINAPNYDFSTHSRKEETTLIKPTPIIIIEGILIFAVPKIRKLLDKKFYVRAHRELRFNRRIERDVKERSRDRNEIVERYFNDVLPSNNFYVEPSEDWADIILVNNRPNKFIGLDFILPFIENVVKDKIHK